MASHYPTLPEKLLLISLKMYFTPDRTITYLRDLLNPTNEIVHPANRDKLLLALIPDFLTIWPCAQILKDYETNLANTGTPLSPPPFLLGAQDCFWESHGAYTGEVSPASIRALGCTIVELGHAERRAICNETDSQTAHKAAATCAQSMVPLVCVGEVTTPGPIASQAVGQAVTECAVLVRAVLDAIPDDAPVIFAYEPVWAIGQPKPAGVAHVAAVVQGIRAVIGVRPGTVRVLYGGSAGPGLWGVGGLGRVVDGMFLGRFAHEIDGVREVVREVEETLALV
ncbi:Triosephosphate isomerase [Penicillium digitatum]|uniref:Triosephosphate isomerase n=3 Tax=Penicillium digitatum TaxID=36651 RepID=K9G271_PEND2|nr:Triosephosphate isomerase [Penicillium digitatum Pd1]EKV09684.1 Triosephosphate isomerase [Penicillium digitatum Pd1]EKV14992.1 Triosephosphate isomerase [Penicillium digitatum PHI26]QQK44550.1 Triosephosphate isomerase [Penicillium digitatum]